MTSHLLSIFKKSLLVTSIGLALAACGGGNGLGNDPGPGNPVDPGKTPVDPGKTPVVPGDGGEGGPTINVRDYEGLNGKIVWDANHDWFVVGDNDKLYAYNTTKGWPDEDSDAIPASRLAEIKGVTVTNDDAIIKNGTQIGSVSPDQNVNGEQFYVLAFQDGTDNGYLDVDFNKRYGGVAPDDKTDPRITQVRAVSFQHSFQGLHGAALWDATEGDLVLGLNLETLSIADTDLNFSFKAPTSDNYHFVLREFDHPYTDLDIRLVDELTGRILASSYSTLSGEVISFPLTAGAKYGVNVNRRSGSEDVSFVLSVKQSPDTDADGVIKLPELAANSSLTINGTIHPVTRFEFLSRFPAVGDVSTDASSDSSSDASSDSLFKAILNAVVDASGDASSDASSDGGVVVDNIKDFDLFSFSSVNAKAATRYTFKTISEGGDYLAHLVRTAVPGGTQITSNFRGTEDAPKTYTQVQLKGKRTFDLQFGEYERTSSSYSEDTIEYELIINRQ